MINLFHYYCLLPPIKRAFTSFYIGTAYYRLSRRHLQASISTEMRLFKYVRIWPHCARLHPKVGYRTRPARPRGGARARWPRRSRQQPQDRWRGASRDLRAPGSGGPGVGFEIEAATSSRATGQHGRRRRWPRAPGRGGSNNVCSMGQIKDSYWLATRFLLLVLSVGVTLTGGDARATAPDTTHI